MKDRFGFDWSGIDGTFPWLRPHIGRRLFFRHAASTLGGYFLLPSRPMERVAKAAVNPIGAAKNCVFIVLAGGPSHADTFDLKEGEWTPAFLAPAEYNGIRFPRGLMPKIAEQMDSVALVRSMRAWALVHDLSRTWVQIGRNPLSGLAKIAPHIGSVVSLELGPSSPNRLLPAFVSLNTGSGPGAGYFAPDHAPFYVSPGGGGLGNTANPGGPAAFERRYALLQDIDAPAREQGELGATPAEMAAFNAAARKLMYNPDVDRVFTFDQNQRNAYGNTPFGNACIAARNLLRADLGTRFIQITLGSWDHHLAIYAPNANLQSMSRQFDQGLGTLMADLKNDGLLEQTLIVAIGEFGRTIGALNTQSGRDHFLQMAAMFAGARIRGPKAIGVTDKTASRTLEPGWSRDRDIRPEDVEATIYSALGIDWTTIRRDDPLGRGFEYVPFAASQDLYGPIHEIWS